MKGAIKQKAAAALLQWLVKASVSLLLSIVLLAGSFWLCQLLRVEPESYLKIEDCIQAAIELLPHFGDLAGAFLFFLDIATIEGSVTSVSVVLEALFGLLLLGIYFVVGSLYERVKHYVDYTWKIYRGYGIAVDCVCHLLLLSASTLAALVLHNLLISLLPEEKYWVAASALGVVIIGITVFAVARRPSQKILHFLLDLLLDIVLVFLIYYIYITGSCISNIEFLNPDEAVACTIVFVVSLLGTVLRMSCMFASAFTKS